MNHTAETETDEAVLHWNLVLSGPEGKTLKPVTSPAARLCGGLGLDQQPAQQPGSVVVWGWTRALGGVHFYLCHDSFEEDRIQNHFLQTLPTHD